MISYQSIFKREMEDFIQFRKNCGFDYKALITAFNHLDHFLAENNVSEKALTEEIILGLMRSLSVKPKTKSGYLSSVRLFSRYLHSLEIEAYIPEVPKIQSDYTPYIFTQDEWVRIIEATDNLVIPRCPWSSIQISLFVRLLYGCGLRVAEALNLLADDVNTKKGVLLIRVAKKRKQRLVPMDSTLTIICQRYIDVLELDGSDYLFQNKKGNRQNLGWAYNCFKHILRNANIIFLRGFYERGPCMHCLRHTFVLRSLRKFVENGRSFDETSPFLSTYLGHDDIRETDKYLNFSYELYEDAAGKANDYTNSFFPEVTQG